MKGSNPGKKEMNYEHTPAVPLRGNWQGGWVDAVRLKTWGFDGR